MVGVAVRKVAPARAVWKGTDMELPEWLPRDEQRMHEEDAAGLAFLVKKHKLKPFLISSDDPLRLGHAYYPNEYEETCNGPDLYCGSVGKLAEFFAQTNPLDGYHIYVGYELHNGHWVPAESLGPLSEEEPAPGPMPVGPKEEEEFELPPGLHLAPGAAMSDDAKSAASKGFVYMYSSQPLKLDGAINARHYFYNHPCERYMCSIEKACEDGFYYVALDFGTLIAPVLEMKKVLVEYHWGPPGVGKTFNAHARFPEAFSLNLEDPNAWDKYTGEKTVLIDAFTPEHADIETMNKIIEDGTGRWDRVIICSNLDPAGLYLDQPQDLRTRFLAHLGSAYQNSLPA